MSKRIDKSTRLNGVLSKRLNVTNIKSIIFISRQQSIAVDKRRKISRDYFEAEVGPYRQALVAVLQAYE